MNTPSVHIVRHATHKLVCIEDEWSDEGTALVESLDGKTTLVGLWRKENGGPACGDARILSLEFNDLDDQLHDQLLKSAVNQLEGWGVESFQQRCC